MADPPAPAPAPCRHPSSTGKVVRGTVCDDCHAVLSWRPPEPKDSVSPAPASAKDPGVIYCRKCGVKMLRYGSGEYGVMCDCVGEAGTTETPPAPTPADLTTPPQAGMVNVLYYCSVAECRLIWGSDGEAGGTAKCLRCDGTAYPYVLRGSPAPTLTEPDAVTRAKGAWDRVQREEEVYGTGSLNGTLLREAAGRCVPALLEEIARLRKEIALCTGPVHTAAEFRAALAEKKEAK